MVSTKPPNPNPNPKPNKNVHLIGGIQVEFPYQPYGSQLAFMCRVISTLDRASREGHCHALLESPTGTGKSLSLLCSILAWQHNYKLKNQYSNLVQSKANPEAMNDPLNYGGGFVPDTTQATPSSAVPTENAAAAQSSTNAKNQKKKVVPTIYYASRTHSQISQVVREYRKTSYRVPMSVLASRKHYCINKNVQGKDNLDEECKSLLKNSDGGGGCSEFKNVSKVKGHATIQKGGCHEAFDIEDLLKVGQIVKGCPYYAARAMADDAQLVFCPYSYLINPIIRGAMDVDIKGAILVLDEAHNIEDIARDAGSLDLEEDILHKLQTELEQLCMVDTTIYVPLYEMTQELISWIERRKSTLEKREFQNEVSCWTGDKAVKELQEANISQQSFPILFECATKAIREATDPESDGDGPHLSGASVITLEGLFSSLTYFFSRNGLHTVDYQLVLQRYFKRDARNGSGWAVSLSLWCLNPTVVFKDIAALSLSIILTSGTLSPMNSFSSELGAQFGTCLEAPHVIDAEAQVWAAVMTTGPSNYPLNASYKTADGYAFQDELGKSLEEICKIAPGGALVFFPSYKLMDKLSNRWKETGQWSRLNTRKPLFVDVPWQLLLKQNANPPLISAEPRGSQDELESVLKDYYDTISGRKKPASGKKKRVKKLDSNNVPPEDIKTEGAGFLAVCRGKVSEGLDFSDDKARVVIVVGIPFPNLHDIKVSLKKKYNDAYKSTKNLINGNEWYCQQAFRALNQAIGRCIRHKFDYGAVILIDERYQEERNRVYISKWLRKSFKQFENFDASLEGLKSFFRDVKEKIPVTITQDSDSRDKVIPSLGQSKVITKKNDKKQNKSNRAKQDVISVDDYEATFVQSSHGVKEETSMQEDSRCSDTLSNEDVDMSIVRETPDDDDMNPGFTAGSLHSLPRDRDSVSPVIKASVGRRSKLLSCSLTNSHNTPFKHMQVSPERQFKMNSGVTIPELESPYSLSVNSHAQKRKKFMCSSPIVDLTEEKINPSESQNHCCITKNSMASMDTNCKINFDLEVHKSNSKSTVSCTPSYVTLPPSSEFSLDKNLHISCSVCRSPLGLPENQLLVRCSLTMSSKVHILSLWNKINTSYSQSIPVVVTDFSLVDQRLFGKTNQDTTGQGIWSKEDGCVYNSIFCPFCTYSNCLGVQVMATDSSNTQLLNTILFNRDLLEIKNLEPSNNLASKNKDSSPSNYSPVDKTAAMNAIDKFSYSPIQQTGGWRSTRSNARVLPRKK
ncbi:hypothetical protein ACFE04_016133 [Oxalis oulophora]